MSRRWKIALMVLCLSVLAVGIVGAWVLDEYYHPDAIERAGSETRRLIRGYERTGDSYKLRRWITTYHGDAPGRQVFILLGDWAIDHPKSFLTLIAGLYERKNTEPKVLSEKEFYKLFGFALADSGQDEEFTQAFQGYKSRELNEILLNVPQMVPWSEYRETESPTNVRR